MKKIALSILLAGGALGAAFTTSALANHRAGDFPLPELIAAGDFNQDGKVDLAVNLSGFDNVAVLFGDGLGGFTLQSHFEANTLSKGIATGDVNGDGRTDIVSINQWGYDIKVHLGDGAGGFHFVNRLNGDGEPTRIILVDLNHDGALDIVSNAPAEGKVLIYLGNGLGGFSNTATELEDAGDNDFAVTTGDFDHDTNLDLAVASFNNKGGTGSHVLIYLGDGTGNFSTGQQFLINPQASDLAVADMNNDGNLDLDVSGAGSENGTGLFNSVYLGDGLGHFTLQQTLDLGQGAIRGVIALADFNEDGNTDIAVPLSAFEGGVDAVVLTFFGDGAGNISPGPAATAGQEPHSALAGDFNRDGHADLAVSNRTDGTITILLGKGDGTFTTHATIPLNVLPE
ncbi:MAG TPA: VCBS repeat-containing protein [Chthoniobacterales bacterium]|nr:VCBS repeat-containing protein [Chthoniobacterales bacterium]